MLPSGLVLFVGGDYWGYSITAELYNPATNAWTPAGNPPVGLRDHTATLLPSGKVLVVGGLDPSQAIHANAAIYDPAANGWTPAASLQSPRYRHTATLLANGKVLVVGGFQPGFWNAVASTELFDPATNTWGIAAPLHYGRGFHTTTVLPSGKLLTAGGYGSGISPVAAELYDPATGNWSLTGNLAVNRTLHAANLLPSGKVLVSGGLAFGANLSATALSELYDPDNGNWTNAASLTMVRSGHTATVLPSGDTLVTGGLATSNISNASAEIYSSAAGSSATANSRFIHEQATATLLPSGKVLVYGGFKEIGDVFDPFATTHVVTLTADANGGLSLGSPQDVVNGSSIEFDVWAQAGHFTVAGGSCGGVLSGQKFVSNPIVADCTIAFTFPFIMHSVVPSAGPHGTITPNTTQTVSQFESIKFYIAPDPGYRASSSSDCATVITNFENEVLAVTLYGVTGDCTVAATFEPIIYSITTIATAGGKISPPNPQVTYGSVVVFTATPDPGYLITALTSDCGGTLPGAIRTSTPVTYTTAPVTRSCGISASFVRAYVVTPTAGPNGAISPNVPTQIFEGHTTQIQISHQPGYFIKDAGGTCGGTLIGNTYWTNPIVADCTVVVTFEYNALWRPAGNLNVARVFHTATLLQSGKVLVTGGSPGGASAELYDPVSNSWALTGSLATARSLHTATLLQSGKVLVAGGATQGGSSLASAELYDPASGTWSTVGILNRARGSNTATLLPSGKVLVTGGVYGGYSQDGAELFDPATNTWSLAQHMVTRRAYHAAALLPNGEVLVAGAGYGLPSATSEIYNPQNNAWRPGPSMSVARQSYSLQRLPSGKILAASGFPDVEVICDASAQAYDPNAGNWISAGALSIARNHHTTTVFSSSHALVAGGVDCAFKATASTEMYFPLSNAWGAIGRLSDPRYGHTATLLATGKVLVAGGIGDSSMPRMSELFDPAVPVARCNLDVDRNGRQEALADGLLIMRYLFGLRGSALTHGAIGTGATRSDSASIEAFLASQDFDIDGNGRPDALTDGLLIIRYLFGLKGAQLSNGALGAGATLTLPEKIIARLNTGCIGN